MRAATFSVVLAIHALFFFLFTLVHRDEPAEVAAPKTTLILLSEAIQRTESVPPTPAPTRAGRRAARTGAPPVSSTALSQPQSAQPESPRITSTPAPDWRAAAQTAVNNALETERRRREQPSVLAPHDFSGVKPGSMDTSKPEFGWSRAATHRLEATPGGLVVNINDRCAITLVLIFPLPMCKIGRMPANGTLFEHMDEPPAGTISAH